MTTSLPSWCSIHTIVFDFDGIFTDTRVYVDENGKEHIACSRADGLAFDILRNFIKIYNWELNYFILSKERNPVVVRRADKLKIPSVHSVDDKLSYIKSYLLREKKSPKGLLYAGNDLNDLSVMMIPDIFSVAPNDSHPVILRTADYLLDVPGGISFVRYLIEALIGVECLSNEDIVKLL